MNTNNIHIVRAKKITTGWRYLISLEGDEFDVSVEEVYWRELTGGNIAPAELVRRSFVFLLERESKSSILRKFDLRVISTYFPEYEAWVRSNVEGS